ncbi:MAG: MFS transporter, partial [Deltaproteobacteria bacterium]|nr:MFS transporter [Deltaproteobacteria bacterium]
MLHRVFGVSDLAIATVLAAFFLGMGLGAGIGGRLASRTRRPARTYALLELGVACWALLSLLLIPRVHEVYAALGSGASFAELTPLRLGLAFAILLPPTTAMGATLPVLISVVKDRGAHWAASATSLYFVNTLGAALGASLTGFVLVPLLGVHVSITLAAGASLLAALLVLFTYRKAPEAEQKGTDASDDPSPPQPDDVQPDDVQPDDANAGSVESEPVAPTPRAPKATAAQRAKRQATRRLRLALGLAACAGLASLAGEVLWTRVLRTVLQGTTQAFSAMLLHYLVGIALGSLLADRLARRYDATRVFGLAQLALALLSGASIWLASQTPRIIGLLSESTVLVPNQPWIILSVSGLLLLPISLALGTSIPLAWRIAGAARADAPRVAGRVLMANTLGGLVGSLVAGFALVPTLGLEASILVLVFVHAGIAAVALRSAAGVRLVPRVLGLTGPLAAAVGILAWGPSLHLPYLLDAWYNPSDAIIMGPDDDWRDPVVFFEEGRNTTVSVLRREGSLRLYNDGRPESGFSPGTPGFGSELSILAGLPSLLAEDRDRAMVIGLGAGHTAAVLLAGPWQRVDAVELEPAVVRAARMLYETHETPFPLDDPRAHLILDDARAQLVLSEPGIYDAIVSQPSHPWLAGSSALYTQQFFQEAKRALRPGGVLALWANLFRMDVDHLRRITRTLRSVFSHVSVFVVESSSFILVASDEPMPMQERVATRLGGDSGLDPFLAPYNLASLVELAASRELDDEGTRAFADDAPLLDDDRPALEFDLARISHDQSLTFFDLDLAMADLPWISAESWAAVPADLRVETLLERIDRTTPRLRALGRVEASLPALELSSDDDALVRGALAEARGDLRGALQAYDQSASRLAANRVDKLRHHERLHAALIARLATRQAQPDSAQWALSSAFALGDRPSLERALELADSLVDSEDSASGRLRRLARARLEGGCAAFLDHSELERSLGDEHVAFMAEVCALEAGRLRIGRRYAEARMRDRRVISAQEAKRGGELRPHNVGAAMRAYRRALAANPAHGLA